MQGRILGIDYGVVRIGVAVSDPMRILATAVETIDAKKNKREQVLERIKFLCEEYQVVKVIVGQPKRTDAKVSAMELEAGNFATELQEVTGLPIELQDERFTSVIANRILKTSTVKKKSKRSVVDQVAAEIILQTYLDRNSQSF